MASKYFFSLIISFAFGVVWESIFNFGYSLPMLFLFLAGIIFLLFKRKSRECCFIMVAILAGFSFGVLRINFSLLNNSAHSLDTFIGKMVRVEGVVIEEPDTREGYTNIIIETQSIHREDVRFKVQDLKSTQDSFLLVRVPTYPVLNYGDQLILVGKLTSPKNFENKNGGRSFDYRVYLAKDDIYYEMYFPRIVVNNYDTGNVVRTELFELKRLLVKNIVKMIPEPEASLGAGIILGVKQSLGDDLMQKFRETGLAHIIVLSGYNIIIIVTIIGWMVTRLSFTARLITTVISIILFAIMVGGGATVLRATLMALTVIFTRILGRENDGLRVLLFVAGIMVFINPMIILYDVSFQLSFMATLAIVTIVPLLNYYFFDCIQGKIREVFVITIATQIFVAPVLLYHMGSISIIAIVTNIFVLPIIPITMFFVALVAFLGSIPILSSLVALFAQIALMYILYIVEVGSRFPWASIHTETAGIFSLAISYGLILIVCGAVSYIKRIETEKNKNHEW